MIATIHLEDSVAATLREEGSAQPTAFVGYI